MARGVSVAVEESRLPSTAAGQRRVSGRSPDPATSSPSVPTASDVRAPGALAHGGSHRREDLVTRSLSSPPDRGCA
ncbi:hypothetical protein GCM10023200_09250 [Actinomycetospora chlora]|uniref:Uncharacterized protein n=1 Tax=Actinomycetospora chlora TaxID=663608 RepID=A0ABP9AC52_9PSEU